MAGPRHNVVNFPDGTLRKQDTNLQYDFLIVIKQALTEDIGSGDVTAALIPATQTAKATVITRESAVLCGRDWFDAVFMALDPCVKLTWFANDGDKVEANTKLVQIEGLARSILTGERTALNFLQTLSGTATTVHDYVNAVAGTPVRILDTRKTIPGLRDAQKYAVTCGGGFNHRKGLYDAILIKENHIHAAGSITAAVNAAQQLYPSLSIEVEVENFAQLKEAIAAGANIALLDNMTPEQMQRAVAIAGGRIQLEASGGIDLQNIREIAQTGVDFISIGAMTKHLRAIDLSMRFDW